MGTSYPSLIPQTLDARWSNRAGTAAAAAALLALTCLTATLATGRKPKKE